MRIKHLVAGVGVVAGGVLLSACDFVQEEFQDSESITSTVREVRFDNDAGDVRIVVGDEVKVTRTVGHQGDVPGKTYRVDGDALVLERCPEHNCWVRYEVTVPAGTSVSGHLDSGNAELVGVASVNVATESGDITVRDVAGDVNATAQSGNVSLTGIGGAVVAGAESGDVTVGLLAERNVSVSTSSGNIELTVPAADYQVEAHADSGDVRNEVGDGASGPVLDLRADSGNVTIQPA